MSIRGLGTFGQKTQAFLEVAHVVAILLVGPVSKRPDVPETSPSGRLETGPTSRRTTNYFAAWTFTCTFSKRLPSALRPFANLLADTPMPPVTGRVKPLV